MKVYTMNFFNLNADELFKHDSCANWLVPREHVASIIDDSEG
jgi:hypothetical protein